MIRTGMLDCTVTWRRDPRSYTISQMADVKLVQTLLDLVEDGWDVSMRQCTDRRDGAQGKIFYVRLTKFHGGATSIQVGRAPELKDAVERAKDASSRSENGT